MNRKDDEQADNELLNLAARLPTAVTPQRDLWPAIEAGIQPPVRRERTLWNSVWAQAAAVVLMIGASSALTYTMVKDGESPAAVPLPGVQDLRFEPVSGSFGSQYNLGNDYQDTRRDLAASLDTELARMQPDTRLAVTENIATIRKAIRDINIELEKEPDNVLLQELLVRTYRDELSLMIKIDEISNSTMRRDDI